MVFLITIVVVSVGLIAFGRVGKVLAWDFHVEVSYQCLPDGNTQYSAVGVSSWEGLVVDWGNTPPTGVLQPGQVVSGTAHGSWTGSYDTYQENWTATAQDCPLPEPEPEPEPEPPAPPQPSPKPPEPAEPKSDWDPHSIGCTIPGTDGSLAPSLRVYGWAILGQADSGEIGIFGLDPQQFGIGSIIPVTWSDGTPFMTVVMTETGLCEPPLLEETEPVAKVEAKPVAVSGQARRIPARAAAVLRFNGGVANEAYIGQVEITGKFEIPDWDFEMPIADIQPANGEVNPNEGIAGKYGNAIVIHQTAAPSLKYASAYEINGIEYFSKSVSEPLDPDEAARIVQDNPDRDYVVTCHTDLRQTILIEVTADENLLDISSERSVQGGGDLVSRFSDLGQKNLA